MHVLNFTLTPTGVARVHDAVICLAKFGETVSIEARPEKVGNICSPGCVKLSGSDVTHDSYFPAQSYSVELLKVSICFFLPR